MEQIIREIIALQFSNILGFILYDDIPKNAYPPYAVITKTCSRPAYFFNSTFYPVDFDIDIYALDNDKIILRHYINLLQNHFQKTLCSANNDYKIRVRIVEQSIEANTQHTIKASLKLAINL